MKRAALILAGWIAIVAHIVGCGGEPEPQGVAKEAVEFDSEGTFQIVNQPFPFNWIQQVPIGTASSALMDQSQGTRFDFRNRFHGELYDRTTHDNALFTGPNNDDLGFTLEPPTTVFLPTNDIKCNFRMGGVETTSMYLTQFFPTQLRPTVFPTGLFYVNGLSNLSDLGGNMCHDVAGRWDRPIKAVYVYYSPTNDTKPHGHTAANGAPTAFKMRIDVDFPASGVTNRYWMSFARFSDGGF